LTDERLEHIELDHPDESEWIDYRVRRKKE